MNEPTNEEPKTKPPANINNVLLFLQSILTEQQQQTQLLQSIKNSVTFFVILAVLGIVIQACSAIMP